jgi:inorganic triphosphatase YgiF
MDDQVMRAQKLGAAKISRGVSATANEEIELKLLVPVGAMKRFQTAQIIARHARNRGVVRRLETIYYDTLDHALFADGLSLRVRRSGSRYVQAIKRAPEHGQPFARYEWQTPVSSLAPDLAMIPTDEIRGPLETLSADTLRPIFATRVRRRTQQLELSDGVVEIAYDEGSIKAGEHCESLAEIELELKSGDARVLYDVAVELLDVAPLRISTQSKSDRGYSLAFGIPPKASKAKPPLITAEHTVDDIVGSLLGICQHHLLSNQHIAEIGGDPEGVHQMRVALRRLRTACMLLRRELGSPTAKVFGAEARWLAQLLGVARDWDVFITETVAAPAAALSSEIVDFDGLRRAAESHRLVGYAALREALVSRRYNRFQLSLRQWIESRGWRSELPSGSLGLLLEPAAEFAERVLSQLHRKALQRGVHIRQLDAAGRHQLRIALKKLRYATEFFQSLRHRGDRDYLASLASLQDALGRDNDAETTQPFVNALSLQPVLPEVQRAIGALMGWQARDRIAAQTTLRKQWQRFKATKFA